MSKIHLVRWETVCSNKKRGGLGIRTFPWSIELSWESGDGGFPWKRTLFW